MGSTRKAVPESTVTSTSDYASRLGRFLPTQADLDEYVLRPPANRLLKSFDRLVIWFHHLHGLRSNDEVSVLLASAHSKVIEIWILTPLGLLHSSYTALRTIVDICTSYTFYRSHPVEWRAVCEGRASWESRGRAIEWHLNYTRSFREMNRLFGLVGCANHRLPEAIRLRSCHSSHRSADLEGYRPSIRNGQGP